MTEVIESKTVTIMREYKQLAGNIRICLHVEFDESEIFQKYVVTRQVGNAKGTEITEEGEYDAGLLDKAIAQFRHLVAQVS